MKRFTLFGVRSQSNDAQLAADILGDQDIPEEIPAVTPIVATTATTSNTTSENAGVNDPSSSPKFTFKSIKPNAKKTFKGNTETEDYVPKPKHKRTHSGFDTMTLENKVLTYEVEGIGKFEYNGTVDQHGVVCCFLHGVDIFQKNGRGELKYPNGTIYEGDFSMGKRHGFGKLIFSTDKRTNAQSLAIGQWKNDMPSDGMCLLCIANTF
jgi:hypothetical protein